MTDLVHSAAVLLSAALLSLSFGALADAADRPLSAPSPTAAPVEPHVFYGVTPVPPPMPKVPVVGKRAGSLVGKLAGGPVAKEES